MSTEPVVTEQNVAPEPPPFEPEFDIEKDFRYEGQIFHNAQREINLEVVDALVADPTKRATHQTVKPWWGHVAFIEGRFVEQVKHMGKIIAQYEAADPETLMRLVNDNHGWE